MDPLKQECFSCYGYGTGYFASGHTLEQADFCLGCAVKSDCLTTTLMTIQKVVDPAIMLKFKTILRAGLFPVYNPYDQEITNCMLAGMKDSAQTRWKAVATA